MALNTQGPDQLANNVCFLSVPDIQEREKEETKALTGVLKLSKESIWKYGLYLVNLYTVCIVVH